MASSRHYVPPTTRRASSQASDWAAKRRAAIERSEVLKAERRRQEEEFLRLQTQTDVHVPVKESGPVEPNGYTPWWEQHEGVGAERLLSQQSRTSTVMVEEDAPRPERARRRQWGKSPQAADPVDNGAPVGDRLYAEGPTFSKSPERHQAEEEEEEKGGDTKWRLRSFLDSPFRKGDQPDWQDADADIYPAAGAGFGMPKTLPGGKNADASIQPLETPSAASRSKPCMPRQVRGEPRRPRETRPAVKAPSQGEHWRRPSGDTGTNSRSDVAAAQKKLAEEELPNMYAAWVPDWATSEEKPSAPAPERYREQRSNVSERSMAYSPSNYEGSEADIGDEFRLGARTTGAHRPAVAERAVPRPWQAMTEPPTVMLPDRSKADLDPTALQPRRPKAAPTVPEVSSASTSMEGSAPAPRKAASARPARTSGAAKRDDWLGAQGGSGANQPRHGDASKASKEDEVTRQMVDKRQSRKDNQESFAAVIHQFRQRVAEHGRVPAQLHVEGQSMANVDTGIDVFVRKRPQFKHEVQRGEYDIVTVPFENQVVVHNCQMYPDLKRMLIKHQGFPATCAFGHQVDNIAVYERAAAPLIHWAAQGGVAALFMYGQTGSGKTFTMSSIEELGVLQLFEHTVAASKRERTAVRVRVAFFEITGKRCFDLLHHKRREIFLKDSEDGYVILQGAEEPFVESADELLAIVNEAKGRRSTHATDVNASSSRSHAVLRITVERTRSEHGAPYSVSHLGRLTLVDCAGSERKEDSMYHDAERRKEAAEINASLYALRECVRFRRMERQAAAAGGPTPHVHVPYRSSQLTRVLMECFVKDDARMAVIATVSPNPTDTEHIVSTLRTACMISGSDAGCRELKENVPMTELMRREQQRQVAPIHWSHADVKNWLRRVCKGAVANAAERLSRTIDGRALVRMNELMLRNTLSGGDPELAAQIYDALRQEIARVDQYMAKRRQEARDTAARAKSGNY